MPTSLVMALVGLAFLAGLLLGQFLPNRGGGPHRAVPPGVPAAGLGDLQRLESAIGQLGREHAARFGHVDSLLRTHGQVANSLASTTQALRQALASTTARGQWGERMADDVLRSAGFVEHVNYVRQAPLSTGRVPDFTFLLPKGQVLHMDVKFPLSSYLRMLDAPAGAEQDSQRTTFLRDVRLRVKELADRSYHADTRSVGYVLLFLPNETVNAFIHEHDPTLIDQAMERNVVLCTPQSMFAVLGVIRHAFDNFMVEQTSGEVLRLLGTFRQQWQRYAASVDTLQKRFAAVHNELDQLAGPRRRQLERPLDDLDRLRNAAGLDPVGVAGVVGSWQPPETAGSNAATVSELLPHRAKAVGYDDG